VRQPQSHYQQNSFLTKVTARSTLIGVAYVAAICRVEAYSDYYVNNTWLAAHHFPIAAVFRLTFLVLCVNIVVKKTGFVSPLMKGVIMTNEFKVPRRRWGRSNIEIPVIPFGTQGFGNHFGFVSDEDACALIRRAVDIGVNHFDCALCYGDSVRKLGLAIKSGVIDRSEIIISGRHCCHGGNVDYSAEGAIANVEEQLEGLGTDYFDAVFIHDPGEIEPTLAKDGTLEGLLKLKSRGLVRNVGYGMNPHHFHLKAIETGDIDVLLTFNDYNLFGQTAADDILPAAAANDIGVLNGWSIKRGLLTGIDLSDRDQNNQEVARATKMRQWHIDEGVSLLALALQFCLREERIHGNPIGSLNIEQLEMNARAVSEPLPSDIFERFEAQNF